MFTSGEIKRTIAPGARRNHVVKYGSESKFTTGTLQLNETHVRLENISLAIEEGYGQQDMTVSNAFLMYGQYEVKPRSEEPFAVAGDSGSLVLMLRNNCENDLVCIGMVIGISTHGSCIVTPIGNVLDALNPPLRLTRFENSSLMAPRASSSASNDNTLQLILGSINDLKQSTTHSIEALKQSTKQSIDALESKFEMRFIYLERKLNRIKPTYHPSDRHHEQHNYAEMRTNGNDADSDDSL